MADRFPHPSTPSVAPCGRRFPEELLSGFLDGALTQGDEQRVRLHLEDCPVCRAQVHEMSQLREVTMSTRFEVPHDQQWDETPRGSVSRWFRNTGWILLAVWLAGVVGFTLWQLATGPESLLEKTLVFGGVLGVALLFLSVLLDRLRDLPGDRYRNVRK